MIKKLKLLFEKQSTKGFPEAPLPFVPNKIFFIKPHAQLEVKNFPPPCFTMLLYGDKFSFYDLKLCKMLTNLKSNCSYARDKSKRATVVQVAT
jgi:hypothetical protein